jgi:hypothetical protein
MLVERFQMINPKWLENQRMGRWNRGTKKNFAFTGGSAKTGSSFPVDMPASCFSC